MPVRKDRPVPFVLPPIETEADLTKATSALLMVVGAGDLNPSEAAEVGKLVVGVPLYDTAGECIGLRSLADEASEG
ncbi:hypothetical protein [Methylobacterium tarhaniae]|uniref:hypothetical protein n=1 Tax=Methylobacterium tarhaniae TaxID=1187852 RepID=UPI003CFFE94D